MNSGAGHSDHQHIWAQQYEYKFAKKKKNPTENLMCKQWLQ